MSVRAKEYIAARIRVEDRGFLSSCWVWQKSLTEKGYGRAAVPGFGKVRVHRASYEIHVGQIPDGLTIDHLCRVKSCCNPDHLEAVTEEENRRRANAPRDHCPRGHKLTPESRIPGSPNGCRICRNLYALEWKKRNYAKAYASQRRYLDANRATINAKSRAASASKRDTT